MKKSKEIEELKRELEDKNKELAECRDKLDRVGVGYNVYET